MGDHLKEEKKPIYKKWWFWAIVIFLIWGSIGANQNITNKNNNVETSSNIQEDNTKVGTETNQDLSKVIFEDKNFLVKIINYEYSKVTNTIKVNMYIENNSDRNTTFTIDGNVSINNSTVKGGYFYQEVNSKTKTNASFTVSNLKDNGINENNIEKMQFNFDIYQSKDYMIDQRIADDLQITYEFKK